MLATIEERNQWRVNMVDMYKGVINKGPIGIKLRIVEIPMREKQASAA